MLIAAVNVQPREREHLKVWIRTMRENTLKLADKKLAACAEKLNRPTMTRSDYEALLKELAEVAGLGHSLQQNADGARRKLHEYAMSAKDTSPKR